MRLRPVAFLSVLVAASLVLVGCTGDVDLDTEPTTPATTPAAQAVAVAQAPVNPTTLFASSDPTELALNASRTFFASAQVAVLAPAGDQPDTVRAASIAMTLGVPVLLAGADDAALDAELLRLGVGTIVPVGAVPLDGIDTTSLTVQPAPADTADLSALLGLDLADAPTAAQGQEVPALAALAGGQVFTTSDQAALNTTPPAASGQMSVTEPAEQVQGTVAVADGDPAQSAAVGTARAAGAQVVIVSGDPRASADAVTRLGEAGATSIVGLGTTFGDEAQFAWRTATAATGVQLPGGGQLVFPGKRYVALYGSPHTASLGVLGEQGVDATVQRAADTAAPYQALTPDTVIPALEIIVTVGTGGAGEDGNYSEEWGVEGFIPLIEAAQAAGQYVVLDLQPGRSSFLDQIKLYESLLQYPNVGVALDPEWRLGPNQVHLVQNGHVGIDEVNSVVTYLADFVQANHLPQKLIIMHQFQLRMIDGRERLDTSRTEVALLIHADGQGSQGAKADTWDALHVGAPTGVYWGWKNFIDEDVPMLTPEQTYQVVPIPDFVSYQ